MAQTDHIMETTACFLILKFKRRHNHLSKQLTTAQCGNIHGRLWSYRHAAQKWPGKWIICTVTIEWTNQPTIPKKANHAISLDYFDSVLCPQN